MIDVIRNRKSIRKYKDTSLTKEQLDTIKEAIQLAPTWKNKQCFEVIVVEDKEKINKIGEFVKYNPGESAYTKAPVLMIFLADPSRSGIRDEKPYYMADTAIAIEHACLCATSLGLATCWVGVFPEETLKQYLNIPSHLRIVALLPIGYPDEKPLDRPRRDFDSIFHKNTY